jgi:CHAD domain-containing protein
MPTARPRPRASARPPRLAQVLDQRVDDLRGFVRQALRTWDEHAVHQARVTTRRLKAALDLLRPLLPETPSRDLARALRKLRRTLGPLRDLDVMLNHLAEMKVPPGGAAPVAWRRQKLQDPRTGLRRDAARALTPRKALARLGAWEDLEQEVGAAETASGPLLARVAPQQVRDFAARADRLAMGQSASGATESASAPEDVHALRVAGKLLRYTLELAEPLGHDVPKSVVKDFKALQEALGQWHDYVVLAEQALSLALEAELAAHRPDLFGQVLEFARTCWRRSDRHLEQFRTLWRRRGADLADRAAGAFDATAPATEARATEASVTEAPPMEAPVPDTGSG